MAKDIDCSSKLGRTTAFLRLDDFLPPRLACSETAVTVPVLSFQIEQ
jgi:hypothetical protein